MTTVDRADPVRLAAQQRRDLAAYLTGEVHPFSPTEARRLDASGIGPRGFRQVGDLAALPPVALDDVDGIGAVLRPTPEGLDRSSLRWRWLGARLRAGRGRFVDDVVDPRYRAIHFDDHDGTVVASTATDLDRLGELGRRWLEHAGVVATDAVVSVLPARADLAFWQLTLGCRRGGVPALHLGESATADLVASYAPTVLAGTGATLRKLAKRGADLDSVRLLLVVVDPLDHRARAALAKRYPRASQRLAWAPPGVRALWPECEGGALHTFPDTELIEVVDQRGRPVASGDGEILWTPIGWRGTVILRLSTSRYGHLVEGPCQSCGRTTARLELGPPPPAPPPDPVLDGLEEALAGVLAGEALVADWTAEHRSGRNGGPPRLTVRLAPVRGARAQLEECIGDLGRELGADRIVVERPSAVQRRITASGGRRVVHA